MTVRRVVVAGGSVAAMTVADTLLAEGFDGSLTVVSDERVSAYTRAVEQARKVARVILYGDDEPPLRPSRYRWTEQFGVEIKMAGAPGPTGPPYPVEGDLEQGSALLLWPDAEVPTTAMAYARRASVGRLKRWVTTGGHERRAS